MGPKQSLVQAHILFYPCISGQGGALIPFSVSAFIISCILQKFFYLKCEASTWSFWQKQMLRPCNE